MELIIVLMNLSIVFLAIGNYYLDKRLDNIHDRLRDIESTYARILFFEHRLDALHNRVASASGTEHGATKGD